MVISPVFRSALKQEIIKRQVLPLHLSEIRKTIDEVIPETGRFSDIRNEIISSRDSSNDAEYILEPSATEALGSLLPHLVRMQFYQIVLEANASEHSARRVAMKNASDNAAELSDSLLISYNKVRQAAITSELIEITGTQSALS
jgi:F-type H+-transporting ATPase subunit gamma